MSPASYRTAPPRVARTSLRVRGGGLKSRWLAQEVEGLGDLDPGLVAELDPLCGLALLQRPVGCGEVVLGPLQQCASLRPITRARMLVAAARVLVGWRRRARHVADRVDEGVADADL